MPTPLTDADKVLRNDTGKDIVKKLDDIAQALGVGVNANQINYDNTESGLEAENVQNAIDELNDNKADKTDLDITTSITTPASVQTFNDGGDNIPMKSLVTEIIPSQDGFVSCVVTRIGENIFGGNKLLSNFQTAVPDCIVDTTNKTIYFNASDTQASTIVSGIFKENTQYSFIITGIRAGGSSSSSKAANLRIYYTDDTREDFNFNQREVKDTFVFVSAEGKTVRDFRKANASGNTTLYYEECGIFEGIKTVSDFVSYMGNDYTIILGETLTQGGTLEAVSGLLTRSDMTTKQLIGVNIPTLSGLNNVYTDCGNIQSLEYFNNKADDIASLVELESGRQVDLFGTLTAGQTTVTISSSTIKASSSIDVYTDTFGVNPTNIVVMSGQVVLTFPIQANDLNVKVRIS